MARTKSLNNQKGYILISGILVTGFIFTLLFSSSWIFWFLREKQTTQRLCYEHALKAQKILIQTQENVLSLNKRAWKLIIEKKALKAAIKITPLPLKLAPMARLKVVLSLQHQLKAQQKVLIYSGNFRARGVGHKLNQRLKKKLVSAAHFWQKQSPKIYLTIKWTGPQIKPRFKEIAPPYKVVTNYEKKQILGLRWEMSWGNLIPKSWKIFTPAHSKWYGSCFSHPYKKGEKWFANIGPGKL